MALILNLETSTNICSVALAKDGKLLALKEESGDRSHAALLTIFIEEILKENNLEIKDLDAVAVSKGPGSYTGLRIGVSTAKGICYATDKPLISVNTLQAISQAVIENNLGSLSLDKENVLLCPMIDARRMEVYSEFFNSKNEPVKEISADIIDEESYKDMLESHKVVFFGNGAEKCKETIKSDNAIFIDGINTSATGMVKLAEEAFNNKRFEDVAYFEPFYLKDFVALKSQKKLF